MLNSILSIFGNQDKRNVMLRNNILFSAILKTIGLITSLLIVPITLRYLDNEEYGIWLTISSILYWFSFFDIGLGNGMRNYLTQAISNNDFVQGRAYLSTTLTILTIIACVIGLISLIPLSLLNFNHVLNTTVLSSDALRNVMIIAVFFTLANFVVKNIGFVFVALQKYALNDLLIVSGNVLALIIIFIITKTTNRSLLYIVMAFTITPVLVFVIASIPVFIKYPQLRPQFKYFDSNLTKKVVGKGLGFFFIQITSCLIIYGSSNLFIAQFCGPTDVTTYNIAYKYFNLLAIAYTIIISPMWNAYTDAYVKGDVMWIKRTFNRSLKLWGLTVVGGILLLIICNIFYHFWVGNAVKVPFDVSLCTMIYICTFNFNNCVTYLLNGLNKIYVQILTSIIFTATYLIFLLFYGNKLGIDGVVLSMAISYICMSLIHYYQCRLLITQKASGIWNK
jgi:O-antigen/teichoic acid export membrane protein